MPQFFVGPQKVVVKVTAGGGAGDIGDIGAALRRADPVDPVDRAREQFAADVDAERDAFEVFLRSCLASLDDDIVTAVVNEFRHHCTREDSALVAAGDRLVDATMDRICPELRHFQTVLNVAQARCSDECFRVVQQQREDAISEERLRELEVLMEASRGRGAALSTPSEIDLEMIGAINSVLVWLNRFRDALIPAYREAGDAAAEKLSASIKAKRGGGIPKARPRPLSALSQRRRPNKSKTNKASKKHTNGNTKKAVAKSNSRPRPLTAPGKRRRHPPVGGGFLGIGSLLHGEDTLSSSTGTLFNVDAAATASIRGGRGKTAVGAEASRTAFSPGKLKSRHFLKQASGSYYAYEDSSASNRWEGVGSASALARAVSRTPFFNGSGGTGGRSGAPVLAQYKSGASKIPPTRHNPRGRAKASSMPGSRQNSAKPRTTHMRRRRPKPSKTLADVFDDRNVLGRLATVGSNMKSPARAADPEDTSSWKLDGGW
eukprot:g3787.t1